MTTVVSAMKKNSSSSAPNHSLNKTGEKSGERILANAPYFYYRDFSDLPDPDPLKPITPPGRIENFVVKMVAILSRPDLSDIISWMPHGRSWKVHKPREFEVRVIPAYFEHSKFSSFIRQANGWGFRRMIAKGPDRNSYYHELFLRGQPHLVKLMKRPTNKSRPQADASIEPNFYKISEEHPLPELKLVGTEVPRIDHCRQYDGQELLQHGHRELAKAVPNTQAQQGQEFLQHGHRELAKAVPNTQAQQEHSVKHHQHKAQQCYYTIVVGVNPPEQHQPVPTYVSSSLSDPATMVCHHGPQYCQHDEFEPIPIDRPRIGKVANAEYYHDDFCHHHHHHHHNCAQRAPSPVSSSHDLHHHPFNYDKHHQQPQEPISQGGDTDSTSLWELDHLFELPIDFW